MRIGFIGTGSMGSMLVRAYVRSGEPDLEVLAYNRTPAKIDQIVSTYPQVVKCASAEELAGSCKVVFLCVKPGDVQSVLDTIRSSLSADQFLISINSAWSLKELEDAVPCKVGKIIPSLTQEALSGALLCMFGSRLTESDKVFMQNLFRLISAPIPIREGDTRISSDLTSCGPAFFSYILKLFSEAAVRQGNIPSEQAIQLVKSMIYGLTKLIVEERYSFEEIIRRVSVPGGITAVGLSVLEPSLDGLFDELFIATKKAAHTHHSKNPLDK